MIKLEAQNRELIKQVRQKKDDHFDTFDDPMLHRKLHSISTDMSKNSNHGEFSHKMNDLQKEASMLAKRNQKDEKLLRIQKKMFDKHVQK
jgi:hypothetical protein